MAEQTYRIECGNVVYRTRKGWNTSRQIPGFVVRACGFREAARKARAIMLAAADNQASAEAHFGMLDEADNYADERALDHYAEDPPAVLIREDGGTWGVKYRGVRLITQEGYGVASAIAATLNGQPGAPGEIGEAARVVVEVYDRLALGR